MSWDIFIQDMPPGLRSVQDWPDDFVPGPIGERQAIINAIKEVVPASYFSDPAWGTIEGPEYSIEVSLGEEKSLDSFAFHVHGGDMAAGVVAAILERLQLRAIDPGSDSGLFEPTTAEDSLRRWRVYRDRVIGPGN